MLQVNVAGLRILKHLASHPTRDRILRRSVIPLLLLDLLAILHGNCSILLQ